MELFIYNHASKPIYEQISDQIKALIINGELKPGDAIPSIRSMAKSLHISVLTYKKHTILSRQTDLLRQRPEKAVLFRHRIKTFIWKNSRRKSRNTFPKPSKSPVAAVSSWIN